MRELRLIFGSSSAATSAVLAIFMGGLGLGSIYLGRIADRHANPLKLYGIFEVIVALSAMLTPVMIPAIEYIYIATGGTQHFQLLPATLFRLVLSALVLGIPTFFMGGTLPAIAKTTLSAIDKGRRDLGFLYGINTLGALTGVWLVIFVLLEPLGLRNTLWAAGLLNLLVAAASLHFARHYTAAAEQEISESASAKGTSPTESDKPGQVLPVPDSYINGASCLAGFCFFYMELVWYRMLTPLLGGTTYTMGIIMAVALLGIAIGSWGYGMRRYTVRTSLGVMSLICSLEALFLAVPFALGDRIAVLTSLLRPIGTVGMAGYAVGWLCITIIVVLPAAIAAGYQFPLLVGLKGAGRPKVAEETGQIYAWNTLGAIAGSLIGGMVLLPWLGAVGSWQFNVIILSLLAVASIALSVRNQGTSAFLLIPGTFSLVAIFLLGAQGPTATWRHTPIGAGRADLSQMSHNEIQEWINNTGRHIIWEKEGQETSLALDNSDGLAFVVNGKADGNSKGDAGTQIMAPLISAILHPNPQKALVIGLGTGSSTGWLADIESMTRVDTVEIEPAILEVAKRAAPVNRDVLENNKVTIIIGDAREVLLSSREKYDLIVSEPSNPYRSGTSSLYTQEFYQAVAKRLNQNGYFSQWVQGYEVDSHTIKTIYTTLASVFPVVETWEAKMGDLLFVCSMAESDYSVPRLRERIAQEPFRSGLFHSQGITDLEGVTAHFVARSSLARAVAAEEKEIGDINTDDKMHVEYGFARGLGNKRLFSIMDIRMQAKKRGEGRPNFTQSDINWDLVSTYNHTRFAMGGWQTPDIEMIHDPAEKSHLTAFNHYLNGNSRGVLEEWQNYGKAPVYPFEIMVLGESLADEGNANAQPYIAELQAYWPSAAKAILARLYWRTGERDLAYQNLKEAIIDFRTNPWPPPSVMQHSLVLMYEMSATDKELAKKIYKLLAEPFSVYNHEAMRLSILYNIAKKIDERYLADAIKKHEPYPPWTEEFLELRLKTYQQTRDYLANRAERDLNSYRDYASTRFVVYDYSLDNPKLK